MSAVWIYRDLLLVSFANVCKALTDNFALLEIQVALTVKLKVKTKTLAMEGSQTKRHMVGMRRKRLRQKLMAATTKTLTTVVTTTLTLTRIVYWMKHQKVEVGLMRLRLVVY